jgi:hypothetical protein
MTTLAQEKKSRQGKAAKLARDMRGIPATAYRLPNDGRKWKSLCVARKQLADWLATFGDADGSRIFPSVKTMQAAFDTWSRMTIFRRLAELRWLGFLESEGLKGERGPRVRRLNPKAAEVSDSLAGVSDSESDAPF